MSHAGSNNPKFVTTEEYEIYMKHQRYEEEYSKVGTKRLGTTAAAAAVAAAAASDPSQPAAAPKLLPEQGKEGGEMQTTLVALTMP